MLTGANALQQMLDPKERVGLSGSWRVVDNVNRFCASPSVLVLLTQAGRRCDHCQPQDRRRGALELPCALGLPHGAGL